MSGRIDLKSVRLKTAQKYSNWLLFYLFFQKQAPFSVPSKEGRGDSKNLIITTKVKTKTMNIVKTNIEGVLIIEPRLFRDARGYFFESFSEREFEEKVAPIL